jgi:hypothetical protein
MDKNRFTRWRRMTSLRNDVFIAGLSMVAACTADTTETQPSMRSPVAASRTSSPAAVHASTVSFDLNIESAYAGVPSRTMRAHVDRVAQSSGWRTTITLLDDPRAAKLPPAPWRPKAIVIDETGRLTIYRADGNPAAAHDPSHFSRLANATTAGRSTTTADAVMGTAWADELLMATDSRAKVSAKMTAGASATGRDAHGLAHYHKAAGTRASDFTVDPATGIVKGIVSSDGRRRSTAAFEYMTTPSGLSVRTRSHFEEAGGKFPGSRTLTVQHLVIDGQGVIP